MGVIVRKHLVNVDYVMNSSLMLSTEVQRAACTGVETMGLQDDKTEQV